MMRTLTLLVQWDFSPLPDWDGAHSDEMKREIAGSVEFKPETSGTPKSGTIQGPTDKWQVVVMTPRRRHRAKGRLDVGRGVKTRESEIDEL